MPDFKTALYNEVNALSASGALTGTEVLYVATAPNGVKATPNQVKALTTGSDPLTLTEGLSVETTEPDWGGDANFTRAAGVTVVTNSSKTNPGFTTEAGLNISFLAGHGQNTHGSRMEAKKTFLPIKVAAIYNAAGQKFGGALDITSYGMGDTATWANNFVQYAGGPVDGDEGQGFNLITELRQQNFLVKDTISAVTLSAMTPTIITQNVTASKIAQTVTVASTTGLVNGDWVVIGQELPRVDPVLEAVQVISFVPGTSITAIFYYNHTSGDTVTPALCLDVAGGLHSLMGQDRVLVNLSGASYTTGTAAGLKGSGPIIDGAGGASWSTTMVGGDATNIGAITLAVDDVTHAPFDTGSGRLRSWHQIIATSPMPGFSTTQLSVFSNGVAGESDYKGKSGGVQGAYTIRPCARILRVNNTTPRLICETSGATWSIGHEVECVICPYPDVTGWQYHLLQYTPCGTMRGFMQVLNRGGQRHGTGYSVGVYGGSVILTAPSVGGADYIGWNLGFSASHCKVGLQIAAAEQASIYLDANPQPYAGSLFTEVHGIMFGNNLWFDTWELTAPGSGNAGFTLKMIATETTARGKLVSYPALENNTHHRLIWGGMYQTGVNGVSWLPTSSLSQYAGCIATVNDSSVTTPGSTVAGGGANTVLVWCNGTAWKVFAA